MEPFAAASDLEAIWRPLTDAEVLVAEARIAQASRMIRRMTPLVGGLTVDERIEIGSLDAGDVTDIVVEMVRRVMATPGYIRQQSVTVDDATKSTTWDSNVASGTMYLTEAEKTVLLGEYIDLSSAFEIVLGTD